VADVLSERSTYGHATAAHVTAAVIGHNHRRFVRFDQPPVLGSRDWLHREVAIGRRSL